MSKKEKLFKRTAPSFVTKEDYYDFIDESLKPIGFSDEFDEMFYRIKEDLFNVLYEQSESASASFDPLIAFQSVIDDCVETFQEVAPFLLATHEKKAEHEND